MKLSERVKKLRCRLKRCMPCDCEPGHGCFDADLLERTATLPARIAAMEDALRRIEKEASSIIPRPSPALILGIALRALDETEGTRDYRRSPQYAEGKKAQKALLSLGRDKDTLPVEDEMEGK